MRYFTIQELCWSHVAQQQGVDNTPSAEIRRNLEYLVDQVLDPIRAAWGRPIVVNSGYRSSMLNKAVGGASSSHHLRGMAADITAGTQADNRVLFDMIQHIGVPFTQLIDESNYRWIHISLDPSDIRKQILKL